MTNHLEIKLTLTRMAELLKAGGHPDWAKSLESLSAQMDNDPVGACAAIISTFGGMGSLNDLVLYANNVPLRQENQEFDELRSKLFFLIKA